MTLEERMKEYYEKPSRTYLTRRTPVVIRLDGKCAHSFTKGFMEPFDPLFRSAMEEATNVLCKYIEGVVFAYSQSDEITLILTDYKNLDSGAWFNYSVQKLCSIAASAATLAFNRAFVSLVEGYKMLNEDKLLESYTHSAQKGLLFDARAFNVPKEEVCNMIYWRQKDCVRNSIQMVGQAYFTHKELQGKSCEKIKMMLKEHYGIDWDKHFPHVYKYGFAMCKINGEWTINRDMPMLIGKYRNIVNDAILYKEELI